MTWTDEKDEQLIERFNAGELVKVIAADFGCPEHVVSSRIVRLQDLGRLPLRKRPWLPAEDRALLSAVDRGERYRHLAPRFRRSRWALKQRVCNLRKATGAEERDQLSLELTG